MTGRTRLESVCDEYTYRKQDLRGLLISVAIGWLLWQRHMNRFEVPNGDKSIPSSEK